MMRLEDVRKLMMAKLAQSGLGAEEAKKLKFEPYTSAPLGIPFKEAGFTIPYLNNNGFFRYRYLAEVKVKGKLVRYSQPADSGNHVYVPYNFDWAAWEALPIESRKLIITEGELKAACAAKHEIPCIGLGGVYNFKDKKHCLLPELRKREWKGLATYIAYDSDALTNPNVVAAENQLARELLGLGAIVHIVRIPPLGDGKTGLDDYLENEKNGGFERFRELAFGSQAWALGRVLHELNERLVFVKDPGIVVDLRDWQMMMPEKMKESIFSNVYYETQVQRGNSIVTVKKKAAAAWLAWEQRTQVGKLVYAPGLERVTPGGNLNVWPGWGVPEEEIKKGDVSPWSELLDFLFADCPDERRWFERWAAYHVQYPAVKMLTAVVLWGRRRGTGKTLVGYTLRRIYGKNSIEIEEGDLLGTFNEWAAHRQFVQGDEITGSFDKRGSADRIKGFVTRLDLTVNKKYLPSYQLDDVISYFFTSNHPNSFFIEDQERRYFVHEVRGAPLPQEFYRRYDAWYKRLGPDGVLLPGPGIGPLMWHLRNLDLGDFDPQAAAPATAAMRDMVAAGRFPVEDWAGAVADDPDKVRGFPPRVSLMTPGQLYAAWLIYNGSADKTTAQHVGAALSAAGLRRAYGGERVSCAEGKVSLWAVRDREVVERMGHRELVALRDREVAEAAQIGIKKDKI